MAKLRFCALVDSLGIDGGTERQVEETVKRLDPDKFEIHVCCFEPSPRMAGLANFARLELFPIDNLFTWNGLRQTLRFRRYLSRHQIDIVQAYMVKGAIATVAAGCLGGCGVVITSRLNLGYWYSPKFLRIFRVLNRFTTRIMANSDAVRKVVIEREKASPTQVDVVYQGVDVRKYDRSSGNPAALEALGIPAGSQVVGLVANLVPVKDHELFLRAAQLVAKKIPKAVFLLVGSGELYEQLMGLAQDLGIADRVFCTQGQGRVVDYLAGMQVGCLTSLSEGFSNAILEYMVAGLPVVASDAGGNAEAVEDGGSGFLFRDRSPQAVAEPLIRLLQDPDLRQSMGARGSELCSQKFEIGHTINVLESYYLQLVRR